MSIELTEDDKKQDYVIREKKRITKIIILEKDRHYDYRQ